MKRIVQTRTGKDGNCFAACLASILEVPLKTVPEMSEEGWLEEANEFLSKHGLSYKRIPIGATKPVGYGTIEGISPRGGLHACVSLDGELIWDPHPIEDGTGQGLVEPRYYGVLTQLRTPKKLATFISAPEGSVDQHVLQPVGDENTPDYIARRNFSHQSSAVGIRDVDKRRPQRIKELYPWQ